MNRKMPETRLQKRLRQSYESSSNAVVLRDSTSENTEYPITKKSKPPIRRDNKKTNCRTKGSRKSRRLEIASSMNQDSAPGLQFVSHLLHLPAEILVSITSYLKPSELCSIRTISKAFKDLIEMLPVWQRICTSLVLGKPARKYKTYYALAASQMWRICDLCLKRTKGWGSDSPLTIKDTNGNKIGRLCCKCRCNYYEDNPEPAEVDWDGVNRTTIEPSAQITKKTATRHYKLLDNHLRSIRVVMVENPYYPNTAPMHLYLKIEVVSLARKVHGGDIGITKAREAGRARGQQMIKNKNRKTQERREILHKLLVDAGLEHHSTSSACDTFVSGHMTGDQLVRDLQEIERKRQALEARKSLVRKELESHNMPALINKWLIACYIRDGQGSMDEIIRQVVNEEHERQRVETVKNALIIRLKSMNNTWTPHLYLYDDIIKDPLNDIEFLLKTIVYKEEDRIAKQARRSLLLKKLFEHNLRSKIAHPRCEHYIATGATNIDNVVQTIVDESNRHKRTIELKRRLLQHRIRDWTNAQASLYVDTGEPDLDIAVNTILEETKAKEIRHDLLKAKLMENYLRIPPGDAICQDYLNGISNNDIDTVAKHVATIPYEVELQEKRKPLILKLLEYGLRADCMELDICTKGFEDAYVDAEEICTIIKETSWYMQDSFFVDSTYLPYSSNNNKDMLDTQNNAIRYYQSIRSSEKLGTIANRLLESWLTDRFDLGYYNCVEVGASDAVNLPKTVWPLVQAKWMSKITDHVFVMLLSHATLDNSVKWQSLLETDCQEAEKIAIQHLNQTGKDRKLPMHSVSQSTLQMPSLFFADATSNSSTVSSNTSASCHSSGSSSLGDSNALNTNASSNNSSSNSNLSEFSSDSEIVSKESATLPDILRQALGADWLRKVLAL